MTGSEAADWLEEQFGGMGLLLDERGKKIRVAHLDGKACTVCARPFADGEAVYRVRHRKGRSMFGGRHTEIAPVCPQCFEHIEERLWFVFVYSAGECGNCGRMVHETEARLRNAKRHYCCEHCREKHGAKLYAEKARKRRADARDHRANAWCVTRASSQNAMMRNTVRPPASRKLIARYGCDFHIVI